MGLDVTNPMQHGARSLEIFFFPLRQWPIFKLVTIGVYLVIIVCKVRLNRNLDTAKHYKILQQKIFTLPMPITCRKNKEVNQTQHEESRHRQRKTVYLAPALTGS